MQVDVTQELKLRSGEPLERATKVENGKVIEKETLTFKIVAIEALECMTDLDKNITGTIKRQRGKLADKIYDEEKEYSIDETKMLKDRIDQVSTTYVLNVMYNILGE